MQYKIAFRSGLPDHIKAASHADRGDWIVFSDEDGREVHRVATRDVRSITPIEDDKAVNFGFA
jgi:hypothetical protein